MVGEISGAGPAPVSTRRGGSRRLDKDIEAQRRARRTRIIESIALGILAVLPVVPYLTFLLRTGVPRYGLIGEQALLEQATRHVWSGDTLVGPWSRFGWNHPGPLFFYLVAPFQAVFGSSSTGLYIGTCIVNASAAATVASTPRLFARRPHGVAALITVLAWFVAFGNVVANPFSPLSITLPLMAFLVTAALFGRGKSGAIYPAIVFGSLVAQTHIATVSTIVVTGFVALVSFVVSARRRGGLDRKERWRLAIAAAILFVFCIPPLVEQLTTFPIGNMKKLWRFFVHREAPLKALEIAARNWAIATTWMPERIAHSTLFHEGAAPLVSRADPMPTVVSSAVRTVSIVHFGMIIVGAVIAGRRSDGPSLAFLALGALADLIAVSALQAIVGPDSYHLVFWTTAASSVAWMGILSTLFGGIGALARKIPRVGTIIVPTLIVLGLSAAVTTASLQRFWLAKYPLAPASHPELRADMRTTEAALRQRVAKDGTTPIMHLDGAKEIAMGLVLEMEKDRADIRIAEEDRATFVAGRGYSGVAKPLHVWLGTSVTPFRFAKCTELINRSGDIALYGSTIVPTACPE